jgi:hypothetical protein
MYIKHFIPFFLFAQLVCEDLCGRQHLMGQYYDAQHSVDD